MTLSLIAAASLNNAIGKDNHLLWNLPNDMKFFKNSTWAMPVIMGRKTFQSLAGQPLPGRFNIVVTREKNFVPGNEKVWVANGIEQAIELARQTDCKEIFIAGGGQLYSESIAIADRIYLTRVMAVLDGDAFFPEINPAQWEQSSNRDFPADEKHAYAYSFQVWERKNRLE